MCVSCACACACIVISTERARYARAGIGTTTYDFDEEEDLVDDGQRVGDEQQGVQRDRKVEHAHGGVALRVDERLVLPVVNPDNIQRAAVSDALARS
jgi:hypothetical protein